MSETIRIRRSQSTGAYPALAAGELAYTEVKAKRLGIGKPSGGVDIIGIAIIVNTSAPSTAPEAVGDEYHNTATGAIYKAIGTAEVSDWVQINGSGNGDMVGANNLSDVASPAAARSNLGLAIGTNVQAFSSILQATTASFTTALESKLNGIASGATANDTDANLRNRATHTGTQPMATISDAGALATLSSVGTAQVENETITEAKLSAAVLAKLNNTKPGNYSATTAPTVNNDSTDSTNASNGVGFEVGSPWVDTTNDEAYRCVDATPGAAIWIKTTLDTGELGALAVLNSVSTGVLDDEAVTYAKMQNISGNNVLLGNNAGAGNSPQELSAAAVRALLNLLPVGSPQANSLVRINGSGDGFVYDTAVDGGTF